MTNGKSSGHRKGIELFGERAGEATLTELLQIDNFKTYKPLHKHELSEQDQRDALEFTIKITEKQADEIDHRNIKSRMVADGSNKQRSHEGYEKSDGSSSKYIPSEQIVVLWRTLLTCMGAGMLQ